MQSGQGGTVVPGVAARVGVGTLSGAAACPIAVTGKMYNVIAINKNRMA